MPRFGAETIPFNADINALMAQMRREFIMERYGLKGQGHKFDDTETKESHDTRKTGRIIDRFAAEEQMPENTIQTPQQFEPYLYAHQYREMPQSGTKLPMMVMPTDESMGQLMSYYSDENI